MKYSEKVEHINYTITSKMADSEISVNEKIEW